MIRRPLTADLVHGACELEQTDRGLRPHRLPLAVRDRFADDRLRMAEAQPSGVRLVVTTAARELALELHTHRVAYRGAERARGAVDVVVDGARRRSHVLAGGDRLEVDMGTGAVTSTAGVSDVVHVEDLPAGEKVVELWLPHDEQVDLVGLRADAPVHPAPVTGPVWVHHGSSISHGSDATAPTATWPAVAARASGLHLRNLGFGGSALVDPFMARVIRDTPADVISVKLGINVVNLDAMRLRTFVPAVHGFLDTIREGHPATPLLLVSPIHCGIHEEVPGPSALDPAGSGDGSVAFTATGDVAEVPGGRLNLRVVRAALREVVELRADDPHLHHLDGLALYGPEDAEVLPLPDALHPSTEGHHLIGRRFADALRDVVMTPRH